MNDSNAENNRETKIAALVGELKTHYPKECSQYADARLAEMTSQSLETCPNLQITEAADIFRYVALRVLLTDEQRHSPLQLGTMIRILTNFGWDANHRLNFIYKHIVGRPVSLHEQDFGALFVPPVRVGNSNASILIV